MATNYDASSAAGANWNRAYQIIQSNALPQVIGHAFNVATDMAATFASGDSLNLFPLGMPSGATGQTQPEVGQLVMGAWLKVITPSTTASSFGWLADSNGFLYTPNAAVTAATSTITSAGVMSLGAAASGTFAIGSTITGTSVSAGAIVTGLLSGQWGANGSTYTTTNTATVTSTTLTFTPSLLAPAGTVIMYPPTVGSATANMSQSQQFYITPAFMRFVQGSTPAQNGVFAAGALILNVPLTATF